MRASSLPTNLRTPENPHPEVENPEITVNFSGRRCRTAAGQSRRTVAGAGAYIDGSAAAPSGRPFADFVRRERLPVAARGRAAHERLAAAEKVKRTHAPFHFNPMSSRERRVIHLALRDEKELRSESVGVGPARAVVVVPADMPTPPAPPAPPRAPFPPIARGAGISQ